LELGVEELPAAEVTRTAHWLRDGLVRKLAGTRLEHGQVRTFATPRRVVAIVTDVAACESDAETTVRGPQVGTAFDQSGAPTKACLGFARGQGVAVEDLRRITAGGKDYVAAVRKDVGRGAVRTLSEVLGQLVVELHAEKNMRWNDPVLSFARPVRWLLALLDDVEVPIAVSSLSAGRTTRVHRTAAEPVVSVPTAIGYPEFLAAHGITLDGARRREQIVAAASKLAAEAGGAIDGVAESALLAEITNLVEQPTAILGGFDARYLELPAEILTTVMRKHQRYLPVRDADGHLLPHFVAVANGDCDHDAVRAGNEAVLRARYEDAAFFWRADLQTKPEIFRDALSQLAFEEQLGSVAQRADRIAAIATGLTVALSEADRRTLLRAAELAKFDLATHMVVELTSLAGTMAREYARRAGESEAVAQALFDMELPRSAGDAMPASGPGAVLALADRLDLLLGLFVVGANPTGSSDPFGLRRPRWVWSACCARCRDCVRSPSTPGWPRQRKRCGVRESTPRRPSWPRLASSSCAVTNSSCWTRAPSTI
jgi:glycyl-tRNA synthetase